MAGFVFMFSHYSLTQHILGHVNQATLVFIPVVFLGLLQMAEPRSSRGAGVFCLGLLGSSLVSVYFAFQLLTVGIPAFSIWLWFSRKDMDKKKFLTEGVVATGVAVALSSLFYWPLLAYGKSLIGGTEVSSLSLLSFVDFPAWHPAVWVQHIRHFTSGFLEGPWSSSVVLLSRPELMLRAKPENLMGYFGISVLALIGWGVVRKSFHGQGAWVLLCAIGVLFSLGPVLQWAYRPTSLPLPYFLFQKIPFVGMFRAPSRMILFASLGAAVLVALAYRTVSPPGSHWVKAYFVPVLFVGVYSWEMGLTSIGQWATVMHTDGVYDELKTNRDAGAVLEVPVSIEKTGDISLTVQLHMLYQPVHGRPLVVGRPSRHTRTSLTACENTEYLYELTHPQTIFELYSNPALADRLRLLMRDGRPVLRTMGIKYVVFHGEDHLFSDEVKTAVKRFLRDSLGQEMMSDDQSRLLFKVF